MELLYIIIKHCVFIILSIVALQIYEHRILKGIVNKFVKNIHPSVFESNFKFYARRIRKSIDIWVIIYLLICGIVMYSEFEELNQYFIYSIYIIYCCVFIYINKKLVDKETKLLENKLNSIL